MARYSDGYRNNPMYNEEIKNKYIEERNNEVVLPSNYLRCQFSKIADMENELEKDCSNFTVYEIEEYLKLLNSSSFDGLVVLNSQLSLYTQWMLQNNLVRDNQNHYLEIDNEKIRGCVNKGLFQMQFIDRKTVLKWSDELPNPRDKYVLLALFEGIKGKDFCEILNLKPEDINGNEAMLCTGRKVVLSNKLIDSINECLLEDTYYSISGNGSKTMPLINSGKVWKDYPNVRMDVSDFQRGRLVYNNCSRILNYFGVLNVMSANSITESGKLEMFKQYAKENNITGNNAVYSSFCKEVEKQYNCIIIKSVYIVKYIDQLNSYLE